jgi:hypothetical protein
MMGLTATNKGSDFEITPAGNHVGRCYRVIDLGTQETVYMGQSKKAHKVMLSFELLGEDRMADDRPFSISKRYTVSTHEKSRMRIEFESWRGRPFTPEEIAQFQIAKVLGVYGLVNVTHNAGNDGNTYANIASITPLPKGMPKPAPVNPDVLFDLDDRDMRIFDSFSDKLRETIMKSEEWRGKKDGLEDDVPWSDGQPSSNFPESDAVPF